MHGTSRGIRKAAAGAVGAALVLGLAGCSVSVDDDEVEKQIRSTLGAQLPGISAVDCPGDLEGKVGATMTCTLEAGGKTYDTVVKVTAVEGSTVNFDINATPR